MLTDDIVSFEQLGPGKKFQQQTLWNIVFSFSRKQVLTFCENVSMVSIGDNLHEM